MKLFQKLNHDDNVTIVQVTHSNENAKFGSRIVRLTDGMLANP
jgi:ABC-type lipoprotein export system ATPase subunit